MTIGQLRSFIDDYDDECIVTMLQNSTDNPMLDDMLIQDVIAIERYSGDTTIVLIPT